MLIFFLLTRVTIIIIYQNRINMLYFIPFFIAMLCCRLHLSSDWKFFQSDKTAKEKEKLRNLPTNYTNESEWERNWRKTAYSIILALRAVDLWKWWSFFHKQSDGNSHTPCWPQTEYPLWTQDCSKQRNVCILYLCVRLMIKSVMKAALRYCLN